MVDRSIFFNNHYPFQSLNTVLHSLTLFFFFNFLTLWWGNFTCTVCTRVLINMLVLIRRCCQWHYRCVCRGRTPKVFFVYLPYHSTYWVGAFVQFSRRFCNTKCINLIVVGTWRPNFEDLLRYVFSTQEVLLQTWCRRKTTPWGVFSAALLQARWGCSRSVFP